IILDNACILCLTAAAGKELAADAYYLDTIIASSLGKEVHDPWAFYLHATFLHQAFAHYIKSPTIIYHRSLGRIFLPPTSDPHYGERLARREKTEEGGVTSYSLRENFRIRETFRTCFVFISLAKRIQSIK
ncbi:hypothetical protein PHJA_002099400, partial [Phtheirospermum japonicum]